MALILGLTTRDSVFGAEPVLSTPREKTQLESRDALLLLDNGPLHLRFVMMLNGKTLSETRAQYVQDLIKKLDINQDGKLTRTEANRSPLLEVRQRKSARKFLESLGARQVLTSKKVMQTVQRIGGETVVYRQDESSASIDLEVFTFLDQDNSGILDRMEISKAADRIMEKDQDLDECVSFREFQPPLDPTNPLVVLGNRGRDETPDGAAAKILRDLNNLFLPGSLITKYDKVIDKKLSGEELGWDESRIKMLDQNGDLHLDREELRNINKIPIDLELAIELSGSKKESPALRIISTRGVRQDDSKRPDFAKIEFANDVLTVSFRKLDPVPAAIENAMERFNRLDADNNGYLDKEETQDQIRFTRGLFDSIDFDSDGKIFGEEMEKYVSARGEPATSTCRVNVYDTGRGYFQVLDRNSDGRISVREIRKAHESLMEMQQDDEQGLSANEPTRHFHIEFVRGSFQLFGRQDQMISMAPKFEELIPVGPIWFQRMDRNGDGDLTWNEFLGPREVFIRLDNDHDSLVDPNEAEKEATKEVKETSSKNDSET